MNRLTIKTIIGLAIILILNGCNRPILNEIIPKIVKMANGRVISKEPIKNGSVIFVKYPANFNIQKLKNVVSDSKKHKVHIIFITYWEYDYEKREWSTVLYHTKHEEYLLIGYSPGHQQSMFLSQWEPSVFRKLLNKL